MTTSTSMRNELFLPLTKPSKTRRLRRSETRSMSFIFIPGCVRDKALKSGSRGHLGNTCRFGSIGDTPESGLILLGVIGGFQMEGEPWHDERYYTEGILIYPPGTMIVLRYFGSRLYDVNVVRSTFVVARSSLGWMESREISPKTSPRPLRRGSLGILVMRLVMKDGWFSVSSVSTDAQSQVLLPEAGAYSI